MDSDDATDIISELPEEKQKKVISKISDAEHKADIKELLKYDEDSAGGLMAKELIKVNENWSVTRCVKEMRTQASEVTRVHSVYVVDNDDILLGRLSLKDLLVANPKTKIKSIYKKNVDHVFDTDTAESVASTMQKYDLGAIPVVNKKKKLLGRITIDDIVDLIKEEAEEDYQLAAGILQDVDVDDSIFELTRARLPWLIYFWQGEIDIALALSIALVAVVIVAGIIGTFIPLFLNKRGIDPAIATGPFITTSNDIFGILIYFMVAKLILQF